MTTAQVIFKKFGLEAMASYLERPADGQALYECEHGHDDCAHIRRGPCLAELTKLVKGAA